MIKIQSLKELKDLREFLLYEKILHDYDVNEVYKFFKWKAVKKTHNRMCDLIEAKLNEYKVGVDLTDIRKELI